MVGPQVNTSEGQTVSPSVGEREKFNEKALLKLLKCAQTLGPSQSFISGLGTIAKLIKDQTNQYHTVDCINQA